MTGTLDKPVISEAGRAFLAGLLAQLSDAQLHDLFDVSRMLHAVGSQHRRVGRRLQAQADGGRGPYVPALTCRNGTSDSSPLSHR